ncbi:hypothetical protein MFIFM68171_04951 [Madurella fahalii]|uniref:Uncharacterized protein n=1 Tax=Madurella fahalii TaxID=1157608 RepID=A0ABQ0GAJ0_9PEZI
MSSSAQPTSTISSDGEPGVTPLSVHPTGAGSETNPAQPDPLAQLPELGYDALPNATSIRVLDVIESGPTKVRCRMRVVDLDDEPTFAALSYTWGNPVTIYENPLPELPDIGALHYPEDSDKLPFSYSTLPTSPEGESFVGIDGAKGDYFLLYGQDVP